MQLSLSTLIVIISLMASIVSTASKEENKKIKIKNESKAQQSYSNEFHKRMMKYSPMSRRICQVSEPRKSRMTYVKAILANPKISPSQHLAEKLARAELKSPKMQETFKKLTAIHSSKGKNYKDVARSKISDTYKLLRFKGARKRQRTRHKKERRRGRRIRNSGRRKCHNSRRRLARQIGHKSGKNEEDISKNRHEKSIDYRPDKNFGSFNNEENFQGNPYANLNTGINYPGVEDFDGNLENSVIDESNSLNYGSDYLPIKDQMGNADITNSIADDADDFSLSNDQSSVNKLIPTDDNFGDKVGYGDHFNDMNFENNQKYENSMGPIENDYSKPDEILLDQYELPDRKNVRNRLNDLRIQKDENFRVPNAFGTRRHVSSSNPKYPTGPMYSAKGREKNHVTRPEINVDLSSSPGNISEIISSTTSSSNISSKSSSVSHLNATKSISTTTSSGKILRTRKASRTEKTEQTMETSIPGDSENFTTTEMNPKVRGIGDASILPAETIDDEKNSKETRYNLYTINTNSESEGVTEKLMGYGENTTNIAHETKEVAGQILNKIIEELEDLKTDRNKNNRKEGLPCKLSGSWITTQAGVRIDMLVTNRRVNISMAKFDVPVGIARQGLLNYTWNITGYAPFRRGGPFSLVATDNHTKSLAVFVGACRVCQGVDTIEGVWSIAREPRDCRDFQMATSIHNDIFRRTELLAAIKEKQSSISNLTKYTSASFVPLDKENSSNAGNAGVS